jgi:energy-coupling factor transporter ATP-binding protein EcfA2
VTPEELAERIRSWAAAVPAPAVVAFDGPSGSGKTTLARAVLERLPDAAAVHLDDLYPGWDGLDAVGPLLVSSILARLPGPAPIVVPSWDWDRDVPGPSRPRPDLGPPRPAVVLLEGAGSGARACAPYLTALVWVDAPEPVRKPRALERDGGTYAPHWDRWARQERAYLVRERTRERADLVLDTTGGPENPVVVRNARSVASPG